MRAQYFSSGYHGLGEGEEEIELCPEDSVIVNGQCRDRSVLCGPGTQWVDADKACVPLIKYMSKAQIDAALKAGINLTGGGAVKIQTVPTTPVAKSTPAATTPEKKSLFASMFSGNTPLILGGVLVGAVALTAIAKPKRRAA